MNQKTEWAKFRRQWIKDNPPNHQGAWICGICGMWVYQGEMELDHIKPQGWGHKDKFNSDNIQPSHAKCNRLKGSKRNYSPFSL